MISQFRAVLDGQERTASQELNNPINIEEEHRKHTYPDICTPTCPHVTCGYRTEENKGRPCFMKWKQAETQDKPLPHSVSPTSYSEGYTLAQMIEKALKPYIDRLEKRLRRLENEPDPHVIRSLTPTLNGERLRIDRGMNQSRINYD